MNWFLIALIPPFLWGMVNHIDKYLLSRFLKVEGPGALLIFSSLAGILVFPISLLFDPNVLNIPFSHITILVIAGIITALSFFYYFKALFLEEVTLTVPVFQTIPVFSFILAYFLLGEVLSIREIFGSLIVITGAVILSIKSSTAGIFFEKKVLSFMLISSFFAALYDTLFKFSSINESFWVSIFWLNMGLLLTGITLFLFVETYRQQFLSLIHSNGRKILSLNIVNEILNVSGSVVFNFALLLAPIALVTTVGAYQPVFVFITGVFLTLLFPSIGRENLDKKALVHKIISIFIIVLGSALIYV